nr:MAG TPA: hypothetical protein [Caudoviricetes sp.]
MLFITKCIVYFVNMDSLSPICTSMSPSYFSLYRSHFKTCTKNTVVTNFFYLHI